MKVLYSPLGFAYGSLFSAIVLTRPDHVVVITSAQASVNVPTVVDAARELHRSFTIETHTVSDPFVAFDEGRQLARKLAESAASAADPTEIIVNLVGGTTALQDAVQCIARILDAREIAVVDRRSVEEQRRDPFVIGELVEVPPFSADMPAGGEGTPGIEGGS